MFAFSIDRLLIGLSFLLAATPGPLVLCGLPKRGNQYLFSYRENTYSKAIQRLVESIYPDKEPTASEQPTQPSDPQTPANASDKTQGGSRYDCTWAEWSDWGPKTTLFRCGHRVRTRQRKLIQGSTEHPSVCYGGAKHEEKTDCKSNKKTPFHIAPRRPPARPPAGTLGFSANSVGDRGDGSDKRSPSSSYRHLAALRSKSPFLHATETLPGVPITMIVIAPRFVCLEKPYLARV